MSKVISRKHIFKFLFFSTAILYIFLYVPFGFEGTDTGYIFGSSWNIYNGVLPHRDFIYTRPAIPAYFHTIFLYISETYGYVLDRVFFYIQVFGYSYFGIKLFFERLKLVDTGTVFLLATLAAIFSIHNYPPMGWNTIDGVFFMVLGMYLLLKRNANWTAAFFGMLLIVMGTFSKQSFYFMPIFIFIFLVFDRDWRRLRWYCGFGILWVGAYVLFKVSTNSFAPFIEQTFVRTDSSALFDAGFKIYYATLKVYILWAFAIGAAFFLAQRYLPKKLGFSVLMIAIATFITHHFMNDDVAWSKIPTLFQLWLLFAGGFFLVKTFKNRRYAFGVLLVLISWSAGISNGYKTPIHFSLPFILSLFLFFELEKERYSKHVLLMTILLFIGVFFYGYQTIYRDNSRSALTYNLSEVYPELTTLKTDKETYEKLTELQSLAKKYPTFTVLPSLTQAHYLTRTINPIGTDWPLDVEINNESEKLQAQLAAKNVVVFMENSEFTNEELEGYELVTTIENSWKLVEETSYFRIYRHQ